MSLDAAGPASQASVQVVPVVNAREQRRFIRFPESIYGPDSAWIAPLHFERRQLLSRRNPVFQHLRWQGWIAYREGQPVGRISAQIDALHLERYQDATGYFGMLEAEDRAETFLALTGAAEEWLREQGLRQVRGPFNLSINEECGLLVEGFDIPPVVMTGHARPYYGARLEESGYLPAKDMLAYLIDAGFTHPPLMRKLVAEFSDRVRLRPLRSRQLKEDLSLLRDIFNDAWSENWGFVPFTEAEFQALGKNLRALVDNDFIQIAEVDGEPAAMMVILPNLNEAIQDLKGRLLPFGWAKLLWRLKVDYPRSARIPLMGVRKRYQRTRLGVALAFMVIGACQGSALRRRIQATEMSWILEDNHGLRHIIESLGGKAYKRYRLYQKSLL